MLSSGRKVAVRRLFRLPGKEFLFFRSTPRHRSTNISREKFPVHIRSLGLWEDQEQAALPYHPSIKHVAFRVDLEGMKRAKAWLDAKRIDVRTAFGFTPEQQPLVLNNTPQSHAALYFQDLDGNSLEFITPLRLDVNEHHPKMTLDEWLAIHEEA